MNILLYPNLDRQNGLLCTRKCAEKLRELGAEPMLDLRYREAVGDICTYGSFRGLLAKSEAILSIGGDGTLMRAARHGARSGKPILGANAGRLGFLTQLELHELDELERLVAGEYTVHSRMMIELELTQGGKSRRYAGLNDIIVNRSGVDHIVDIEVHQEDRLIAKHRADGIVFATPTGSTAYSLSAGGPVVDPEMDLFVLTVICPHTTWGRSMVLPAGCAYTVAERSAQNPKGLAVFVDGRKVGRIAGNETLRVRRSPLTPRFIQLGLRNFYENVNLKLSWGR